MIADLTDADYEKIINMIINYWLDKISDRTDKGQSFEDALSAVKQEILER